MPKKSRKALDFETAFGYPFKKPIRLWYILWGLIPILGWFAIGGFTIRIVNNFIKGDFKEIPRMEFSDDLSLGAVMFIKALPAWIAITAASMILSLIPIIGFLSSLFISLFLVPILSINFIKHQTVESYFDFQILKKVFDNISEYSIALLKQIALGIIYIVLTIVLVGIPAGQFSRSIFIADFYGKYVK